MTFTFTATVPERRFHLSLTVEPGETVAILGPNGAGKSTLLNIIAGLLRPQSGQSELNGRSLFDLDAGGPDHWMPPHRRGVSMLAQEADLFPHLTVLENVAFGARSSGMRRAAAHDVARHWLAEVDGLEFAARTPGELSGGQAQRIAVARALASDPALLLLDEPMAALDISVAPALRRTLIRVLRQRSAILVTHDILDALTLADRVYVLRDGAIVEHGPTRDILDRPRTAFTAGLAALNLLTGVRTESGLRTDSGIDIVSSSPSDAIVGSRVAATVRPASVLASIEHATPAVNRITGTVIDLEPRGDIIRVRSEAISADLTPAAVADARISTGSSISFTFDSGAVSIYPL
ncbi:MAG: ABC transporter ATP-binding protein [Leifsonia flava]